MTRPICPTHDRPCYPVIIDQEHRVLRWECPACSWGYCEIVPDDVVIGDCSDQLLDNLLERQALLDIHRAIETLRKIYERDDDDLTRLISLSLLDGAYTSMVDNLVGERVPYCQRRAELVSRFGGES